MTTNDNLRVYGGVESSHLPRGINEAGKGGLQKEVPGKRGECAHVCAYAFPSTYYTCLKLIDRCAGFGHSAA